MKKLFEIQNRWKDRLWIGLEYFFVRFFVIKVNLCESTQFTR